ncbi:MAG: hypothetical protein JNK89_07270 [Saprospiraceae bacterium]|nr:hypothetical protein [Saprospiraceae bacterium]
MKALGLSSSGFKIGNGIFGTYGDSAGTVRQIVHDGDTLEIRLDADLGVRFLGIDTAEVSMLLPSTDTFVSLKNARWNEFFISGAWRENLFLHPGLMLDLEVRIGDGTDVAYNHARQAERGQRTLEDFIIADLDQSDRTKEDFRFFMAFGHEFLDGSGRLLCYLHPDRSNFSDRKLRDALPSSSYNERQLAAGAAHPYFIWPNIQPFLNNRPFAPENLEPKKFWSIVQRSSKLQQARTSVKAARKAGLGVFDPQDPLRLAPFELRFLSRKALPKRYVLDLSQPGSKRLLDPELYYTIPNPEDRLFIPAEYQLLFQATGWALEVADSVEAMG